MRRTRPRRSRTCAGKRVRLVHGEEGLVAGRVDVQFCAVDVPQRSLRSYELLRGRFQAPPETRPRGRSWTQRIRRAATASRRRYGKLGARAGFTEPLLSWYGGMGTVAVIVGWPRRAARDAPPAAPPGGHTDDAGGCMQAERLTWAKYPGTVSDAAPWRAPAEASRRSGPSSVPVDGPVGPARQADGALRTRGRAAAVRRRSADRRRGRSRGKD